MYFVTLDLAAGQLAGLKMTPMQIKRFKLNYAQPDDVRWLLHVMDRESRSLGARIELADGRHLALSVSR
jgi:poly-gamma-glutamate capsule biosynthesis protein CapA/YwtB (metallophosphatase superfamily)